MQTYTGTVLAGSHKATELGFPTINIGSTSDISGIYIGEVTVAGTAHRAAIFADNKRKILEAHLLDFSGDLYGQEASFELFEKIREHGDFADEDALKEAIAGDIEKTRAYFKART